MGPHIRLWVGALLAAESFADRLRRGERGQSAIEYIGVLALVALIILALARSELLSGARRAVTEAVTDLFGPSN